MPVAPVQARSKATYRNILQAAGRLLEREGVANITVQRVAEAAGVDARLVRYYFDDLEGLMATIAEYTVSRWVAGLREMLAGHGDPREAIAHAFAVGWQRLTRPDPAARRQSLAVQEIRLGAARNEALRPLPSRAREEVEATWLEIFESTSDRYCFSVAPRVLARMLYDAWDGIVGDYLTTGDAAAAKDAVDGFAHALAGTITER